MCTAPRRRTASLSALRSPRRLAPGLCSSCHQRMHVSMGLVCEPLRCRCTNYIKQLRQLCLTWVADCCLDLHLWHQAHSRHAYLQEGCRAESILTACSACNCFRCSISVLTVLCVRLRPAHPCACVLQVAASSWQTATTAVPYSPLTTAPSSWRSTEQPAYSRTGQPGPRHVPQSCMVWFLCWQPVSPLAL